MTFPKQGPGKSIRGARLKVDDRKVLMRSTDTIANASDGVDKWIDLLTVHFAPNPANVDINDISRGIKMKIPDVFQQHCTRNYATLVANQVF